MKKKLVIVYICFQIFFLLCFNFISYSLNKKWILVTYLIIASIITMLLIIIKGDFIMGKTKKKVEYKEPQRLFDLDEMKVENKVVEKQVVQEKKELPKKVVIEKMIESELKIGEDVLIDKIKSLQKQIKLDRIELKDTIKILSKIMESD